MSVIKDFLKSPQKIQQNKHNNIRNILVYKKAAGPDLHNLHAVNLPSFKFPSISATLSQKYVRFEKLCGKPLCRLFYLDYSSLVWNRLVFCTGDNSSEKWDFDNGYCDYRPRSGDVNRKHICLISHWLKRVFVGSLKCIFEMKCDMTSISNDTLAFVPSVLGGQTKTRNA